MRPVRLTRVKVTGCLGLGTGRSHRTHRGASGPIPREVCSKTRAPDSSGSVRSYTQRGCKFTLTPNGVTGPSEVASGALSERVQLAVMGSPDARCSASGAT